MAKKSRSRRRKVFYRAAWFYVLMTFFVFALGWWYTYNETSRLLEFLHDVVFNYGAGLTGAYFVILFIGWLAGLPIKKIM